MKKISTLCLLFIVTGVQSQQFNNWYFGVNAGITFNGGTPVALTGGQIASDEGCATISDASGNLLFYSDGVSVWNRNHIVMPNGSGLTGGSSSTQSATILPAPSGAPGIYYVITPPEFLSGVLPLSYSIVDMSLQGGLGDITTKNVPLLDSSSEKVAVTRHANGQDIWVIATKVASNTFYSFQLTSSGFNPPVISSTGTTGSINNSIGYLKCSPCGKNIAAANWFDNTLRLFDFNKTTGVVSNEVLLPVAASPSSAVYGVEFSPDESKLYASNITPGYVYQYDLSSGNSATIIASKTLIGSSPINFNGALQLGPNRKIYLTKYHDQYLAEIPYPDSAGISCGYIENSVFMNALGSIGLPDYIDKISCGNVLPPVASFELGNSDICEGDCIGFINHSQHATSWQWFLNGGTPALSLSQTPTNICYNQPGVYDVTLVVGNSGGFDTLLIPALVNVSAQIPVPVISNVNDTLYCSSNPGFVLFQWYLNGAVIANATDSYFYPVTGGSYIVEVSNDAGCTETSSASIVLAATELEMKNNLNVTFDVSENDFRVTFHSKNNGMVDISIYNSAGELISNEKGFKQASTFSTKIKINKHLTGLYIVRVVCGEFNYNKKIVVADN